MKNRKTGKEYPRRLTACACSRPGVKFITGGSICAFCLKIDGINAKRVARHNAKTSQPIAKYADAFRCGIVGFK